MKAKDIMEPLGLGESSVSPSDDLRTAVKKMATAQRSSERIGVKGLPVIGEKGDLVGMISVTEVLKAIVPSYLSMIDIGKFAWDGMLEDIAKKAGGKKVEDFMTRELVTVHADASLMECAGLIIKHNLHRLPVMDSSGHVRGMIFIRDIYNALVKSMLKDNVEGGNRDA